MQKDNKLFDDVARLASGAAGSVLDIKREIEASIAARVERLMMKMNLVSREEFEVVRAMAATARAEQEKLEKRLAELEKTLKR